MSDTDEVNRVIARLDKAVHRHDRIAAERGPAAARTRKPLTRTQLIQKAVTLGIVLALALIGTIVAGLVLGGVGLGGFFTIVVATLVVMAVIAFWRPREKPVPAFRDDMSNGDVVRRLGDLIARKRHLLPPAAARRADAIGAQLPMLESQLADMAVLDPLSQDARRLLGKHLPDLIDRYERVPGEYRAERDGEGLNVDERLVQGLEAANAAVGDLGRKLARDDVDAFQTQGRFIEDRYREDGPIRSE
ncbi:MAG TPA: hypothetical protein VMG08_21600 [Allosphingosinicella sp.]|nr:hypothetical protein [Allosphingosinicella sp.]